MRIACVGGGPAGLYFSLLVKKVFPDAEVSVFERNQPDDTFGWGVVFSDETLGHFEQSDPESYRAITGSFVYWTDIVTWHRGVWTRSTGHGFSGLSRRRLLDILQRRCAELGVEMCFGREVTDLEGFGEYDLIVAADGANSAIRARFAEHFEPDVEWHRCKFAWFGTDKQMEAFTFIFLESEHGLFQVHAYPFEEGLGTWIVECREEVWRSAGLDRADEVESVRYCERLFADHLEGHRLLTNKSIWRTFPTVRNRTWHHDNIVLIGDAAHTAHFSIGSGTKLAMEDAIGLVAAFRDHARGRALSAAAIPAVLASYEDARYVDVLKTQKTARTSLEWFENSARYLEQAPLHFTFNLMCRSKRITYDNLQRRDPQLIERVTEHYARSVGASPDAGHAAPPPVFTPFRLRELRLDNRIVVSPMCQYSAVDGTVGDWHLVHLGSRAIGGAGLVISEMTDVCAEGRITAGCSGMYRDEHARAWARVVDFVHRHSGAKIGMQLAHAGRKGSCQHPWEGPDTPLREGGWQTLAPSPIPFAPDWPAPKQMDSDDMDRVVEQFVASTRMAIAAGFDLLELHMAHGYLLSSFLSPVGNRRTDGFGGSLPNRAAFPLRVFSAVRSLWPEAKPISVRISATDWMGDEGFTPDDAVEFSRMLKERGCDLIDVSSGGNSPDARPEYGRMYQVPFAERIRYEVDIPVMAVGAIQGADHANTILAAGRADLCAMARPHLYDAYLTLHAAHRYGHDQRWPGQYLLGRSARPDGPRAEAGGPG